MVHLIDHYIDTLKQINDHSYQIDNNTNEPSSKSLELVVLH